MPLRSLWFWLALVLFCVTAAVLLTGNYLQYGHFKWDRMFLDNYGNVSATFLGTVITIVFVDSFARRTERHQDRLEFVSAIRAATNHTMPALVALARARGWMTDGTLDSADLSGATFAGADLERARFRRAVLIGSDLSGASLFHADMQHAEFVRCDFRGANLRLADLRSARLFAADLRTAKLDGADLRGAQLLEAQLTGATLEGCKFDNDTVLPDGRRWMPSINPAEHM